MFQRYWMFFQETVTKWGTVKYAVTAFVIWYIYYGVECALNGGSVGRNPILMPLQLFWEEMLWHLPGGMERRIAYCKENIFGFGNYHVTVCGLSKTWDSEVVHTHNLYRECALDVLPGKAHLILVVLIPAGIAFGIALLCSRFF